MARRNLTTLIDALKGVGGLKEEVKSYRDDYNEIHQTNTQLATSVAELATHVSVLGTAVRDQGVKIDELGKRLDKVETKVDDLITLVELHAARNFTPHQYRSIASLLATRAKRVGIKPGSKMIPGRGPQRAYPVAFAQEVADYALGKISLPGGGSNV